VLILGHSSINFISNLVYVITAAECGFGLGFLFNFVLFL